ncbi:MAG: hypothetical protein ABIB98_01900, partial [bacterium]
SRDKIIMGSDVEFVTDLNHTLIVSAEVVTVEAASLYRPFAVRTSNGESIVSVPMTLPLGVKGFEDNNYYYKSSAQQIKGGKWIIEEGLGITFHLSSENSIIILQQVTEEYKVKLVSQSIVLVLLLWVLGAFANWVRNLD